MLGELGESEVFCEILNKVDDVILVTDGDVEKGTWILWVNDRFSEVTGYQKEEVIGRSPEFLQAKSTPSSVRQKIQGALTSKSSIVVQVQNCRKNGELFWTELCIYPLAEGRYFVIFNRLPSDRQKEIVQILERGLSSIISGEGQSIFFQWDPGNWTILLASRNCKEILGYLSEELEGTNYRDLVHLEDWERFSASFYQSRSNNRNSWEDTHRVLSSGGFYITFLAITLADWSSKSKTDKLYGFLVEKNEGTLTRTELETEVARQLQLQQQISEICSHDEESNTVRIERIKGVVQSVDPNWLLHCSNQLVNVSDRLATIESTQAVINSQISLLLPHLSMKQKKPKQHPFIATFLQILSTKGGLFGIAIFAAILLDVLASLLPDYSSVLLWLKTELMKFFKG